MLHSEPSYLVVASSPLPICVSGLSSSSLGLPHFHLFTSQSQFRVTPLSLVSSLQLPVPGSAQFSSITSQPQFGVTPLSLVSALQVPIPGSGILLLLHQPPLPLSALSVPGLDFSSQPPISSPVVLSYLSTFSRCNFSFSESCSDISVSGQEGVPLPSTPSGMSVLHLISQMCTFDFKFV